MDITSNPLVALFHACETYSHEDSHKRDGRLYVLVVPKSLVKPFNSDSISVVANLAKLSDNDQCNILNSHITQDSGQF